MSFVSFPSWPWREGRRSGNATACSAIDSVDWNKEQDPSVTQLISRVRSGCDESRERLFSILSQYFESLAQRYHNDRLKSKLGVSDIVQQSMIRAVEGFEKFEGCSELELRGWIKTLLLNEIRQATRRWNRQRRDVRRENSLNAVDEEQSQPVSDPSPTPQSLQIAGEQMANLKAALERLPELDQRVVHLRVFQHLTFEQIGANLERTPDSAAKLWYRAVVKLQKDLNSSMDIA